MSDHVVGSRVDAAFSDGTASWTWSRGSGRLERAPWLDGFHVCSLSADGTTLVLQEDWDRWRARVPHISWPSPRSGLWLGDATTRTVSQLFAWGAWTISNGAIDAGATRVACLGVDADDDDLRLQVLVLHLRSGRTELLHAEPGKFHLEDRLAWSPDGSMLAFSMSDPLDEQHLVVLDVSTGAVVAHEPWFVLQDGPGDGWEQDGTLLVDEIGEETDRTFAPFAVTVRSPSSEQDEAFTSGARNDRPTLQLTERVDNAPRPDPHLRWIHEDGSPGPRICEAPAHSYTWVTVADLPGRPRPRGETG